jgi:hypothetical protein
LFFRLIDLNSFFKLIVLNSFSRLTVLNSWCKGARVIIEHMSWCMSDHSSPLVIHLHLQAHLFKLVAKLQWAPETLTSPAIFSAANGEEANVAWTFPFRFYNSGVPMMSNW